MKYTKEGSVTIKAFFKWLDDDTIELCFSVKDTGIGIRKEDVSKLFDSFKRLELSKNRNVEGTGLGLNISKQLVELMRGEITVISEYGKGSTFTIAIPQKVTDKSPIGSLESALRVCRTENETTWDSFTAPKASILVVDDNMMNLTLVKELLKRTEIQVDLATGGKECLELTVQKKYHMILMDHMMPEMDGVETLHRLRTDESSQNRNTTVVALTANATAGSREMYLEYGFNDYFSKPIQADKLEELLIHYLPSELVHRKKQMTEVKKEESDKIPDETTQQETDLLYIDREVGISYCLNSEKLYQQILESFCKQAREYQPQLEGYFTDRNWKQYAIIAHGLKGNSLNIGATAFSKLSLQHEMAAKSSDEAFLLAEYVSYKETLERLIQKLENREEK